MARIIKEILDDKEAAELLGLKVHQVKALARKGELPGRKVGGGRTSPWRFSRQQLLDYVEGTTPMVPRSVREASNQRRR